MEFSESEENLPFDEYILDTTLFGVDLCIVFLGLAFSLTFYDDFIDCTLLTPFTTFLCLTL